MAISFEKLISDVQNFNDSYEIPVNENEKLRLGDIRGQLSNTLARYEAALQGERDQRTALEQTLKALKDAKPEPREEERKIALPAGAPSDDDLNADPWSKSLISRMEKSFNEKAEAAKRAQEEYAERVNKAVGALTQLQLRTNSAFEYSQHKDWPKDYDFTKAFKDATEQGFIDKTTGLPDFNRLHHHLTEDVRIQSKAEKIAEEMFKKRVEEMAESNRSKFQMLPGPRANRAKSGKNAPKYNTLQDYMMSDDAIPTDDEIRAAGGLMNSIR